MQINAVSNTNFQAKDHYLSNQARVNAQKLLQKMNNNNKYKLNAEKTGWQADILSSLSTGKNVKFTDTRYFSQQENNVQRNADTFRCYQQMDNVQKKTDVADFFMTIGKNQLMANSETGKILSYKTGIFTSLSRVISKAEKYIDFLLKNFENSNEVKQHRFGTVLFKKN